MTEVGFELKDGTLAFSAKGHAGEKKRESGEEDVICAAVSILCYTLAQTVRFMESDGQTENEACIKISSGDCEILVTPKNEHFAEALHTFLVIENGFALLAKNFGDAVSLSPLAVKGE